MSLKVESTNPMTNAVVFVNSTSFIQSESFSPQVIRALHPEMKAVHYKDLYPTYTLQDLVSHRAIIMLPYSVMSYKLTEFYSLAIPLFAPSPKFFLNNNGIGADRTSVSNLYCNDHAQSGKVDASYFGIRLQLSYLQP